jgi:hypothetical protein
VAKNQYRLPEIFPGDHRSPPKSYIKQQQGALHLLIFHNYVYLCLFFCFLLFKEEQRGDIENCKKVEFILLKTISTFLSYRTKTKTREIALLLSFLCIPIFTSFGFVQILPNLALIRQCPVLNRYFPYLGRCGHTTAALAASFKNRYHNSHLSRL